MKIQKQTIGLLFFIFILFVFLGDKIPYQPISNASLQTRYKLNNFIMGLFKKPEPARNPYERTEKAVDELQRGKKSP